MNKLLIILLLSPLFCIAQIPKDLPIDSAKHIKDSLKMDSLIALRISNKNLKDSLHRDTLLKVAALKADSIRQAHGLYYNGVVLDTVPDPNKVLIAGEQSGLLILNVSYEGNVIHIECDNCYAVSNRYNLEIHFEKKKE